jgi:3-hydroxyisobutyrate dehydrogenase-like beta-hydroxyacid dehydrogenase
VKENSLRRTNGRMLMKAKERIGFIGLGAMGKLMARNLILNGFQVVGYDLQEEPLKELGSLGGETGQSPADVGLRANKVIIMVRNFEQIQGVLFSENGLSKTSKKGTIIIVMSTISPEDIKGISAKLSQSGIGVIDAPVSGGVAAASEKTLSIMAGGNSKDFEECRGILQAMGRDVFYVGDTGMGQKVKLINQLLVSINLLGICESIFLAKQFGIDLPSLIDIIKSSSGDSWLFRSLASAMASHEFKGKAPTNHLTKDTGIILTYAMRNHIPLPVASLVNQVFLMAESLGLGEKEMASVIQVYEKLGGRND